MSEKDLTLQWAIDIAVIKEMAALQESNDISPDQQLDQCVVQQTWRCYGKPGHSETVCHFRTCTCFKCGKKAIFSQFVSVPHRNQKEN